MERLDPNLCPYDDPEMSTMAQLTIDFADRAAQIQWSPYTAKPGIPWNALGQEINDETILAMVVQAIEVFGGSAHVDCIASYIAQSLPSLPTHLYKSDQPQPIAKDFRARVKEQLRRNSAMFERTSRVQETWGLTLKEHRRRCWTLQKWLIRTGKPKTAAGLSSATVPESMEVLISQAIEYHGGSCCLQDILSWVKEHWRPHPHSRVEGISWSMRQLVLTCSSMNKTFREQSKKPEFFSFSNMPDPVRSRKRTSVRAESPPDPGDDEVAPVEPKKPKRRSAATPPPGFMCQCGATAPGKGPSCKWRRSADGKFLCNRCGLKEKKHRQKDSSSDDDSPWIQCDNCEDWVNAHDDGIFDLSQYDDSNPNHLDYFCPTCRSKMPVCLDSL